MCCQNKCTELKPESESRKMAQECMIVVFDDTNKIIGDT